MENDFVKLKNPLNRKITLFDNRFMHPIIKYRNYAIIILGRFLNNIATFTQSVAIGWQVYTIARLTHSIEQSSFLVGMVGLAQFAPLFALALIAGETADRYDRRKILMTCGILQMACAIAFTILALGSAPSLTAIFIVAGFYGVSRAFSGPAMSALAPSLVPASVLPRAIPWNTLSVQCGMILGPWIGGILCSQSNTLPYIFSGILYFLSFLTGVYLMFQPINAHGESRGERRMTMIKEGLAYLWQNKIVLGAISLDLFAVFLGGATALLPVYARDILDIGPHGFGILRSGPAIGAGVVTLILSRHPITRNTGPWMLWAVIIFGIATIIFAVSKTVWLSVAMLVILGAADSISVFVRQSLVQILTPNRMRGRVSAVSGLFISASNELGEFESGTAARIFGPVGAVIFGGVGSIVITGIWAKIFPALRKADKLAPPEM
jgi:MFS family permease